MKTKTAVDEALARLGHAVDRPWDNGSLPSYEDREPAVTRLVNRWTKPAFTGTLPTRASPAPAAVSGAAKARAALAAVFPTHDPDDPASAPHLPTDRFPALAGADLGLPSPVARGSSAALDPEPSTPDTDPEDDLTEPARPRRRFLARLPRLAAIVAVVVGALVAGLVLLPSKPTLAEPPAALPLTDQPAATVTVDVQGKVANPGVLELPQGSRVIDAIKASGGTLRGTDTSTLNLARRLDDGEQIHVGTTPPQAATATPARININTAPATQLDELPGVGEVMANRIVDFRTKKGRFTKVEQLRDIPGIGSSRFAEIKDLVTVH